MDKISLMLNEMYESRNMVLHLKDKFNVSNKMPVEISTALNCTRITHALQKRYLKFTNENLVLTNYQLASRLQLRNLNEALGKMNSKFTEQDEGNLSVEQKDYLAELILGIEKALLNIGGRLTVELEAKGLLSELTAEQRAFSDEAKEVYIELQKAEELTGERFMKAEEQGVDISEIEEEEDTETGFTLGSAKKSDSKPKQIISPEIDL